MKHTWEVFRDEMRPPNPVNSYRMIKWKCSSCQAKSIWLNPGYNPKPGSCPGTPKPDSDMEEVLRGVMAALAAAISLLENGGKKAAPSDKMFDQMLIDYRSALDTARKFMNAKDV